MMLDPLHPAVVHFPIVFAALLPFVAGAALLKIRRGANARSAWGVVFTLSLLLCASSFVAQQTGRADRRIVADFVAEDPLRAHTSAGNQYALLTQVALVVSLLGFAPGKLGAAGRYATAAGSLALMVAVWRVGHLGGELVYTHGASAPHVDNAATESAEPE